MSKLRLARLSQLINTDIEIDLALLGFRYHRNRANGVDDRLSRVVDNQAGPIV
jgi:hypothetical protein